MPRTHSIDEFRIAFDAAGSTRTLPDATGKTVTLYGDPVHCSHEELLRDYRKKSPGDFLAHMARHAIGNFLVHEQDGDAHRIVTGPAYCGGYICARDDGFYAGTLLSSVLTHVKHDAKIDPFGIGFLLSRSPGSSWGLMPLSTMFQGIDRLPPSSIVETEQTRLVRYESYLLDFRGGAIPHSFTDAIDETMEQYAAHLQRTGDTASLLFSGGVDSLVLFLALRQFMGQDAIRCFTVDHSGDNGMGRAGPLARNLDIALNELPSETTGSDAINRYLVDCMKHEFVHTRGVHLGFIARPSGSAHILHGQNMDSIVGNNMTTLHRNLELGILSPTMINRSRTHFEELFQYRVLLENLQFTNFYLDDLLYQRTTTTFFTRNTKGAFPDPDPGRDGMYRGMLSSQHPNVLLEGDYPADQMAALDRELAAMNAFALDQTSSKLARLNLIRHYSYGQIANKKIASLPLPGGSLPLLIPMSGPLISYFVEKERGLTEASRPKREIYSYARKHTGDLFNRLVEGNDGKIAIGKFGAPTTDPLVMDNRGYLSWSGSQIIPRIDDEATRNHVESIYLKVGQAVNNSDLQSNRFLFSLARYIINLELMMEHS